MLQTKFSGMHRRVCRTRTGVGVRRGLGRVTCASSATGKDKEDGVGEWCFTELFGLGCRAVRQRTGTVHLLNPNCWSQEQDQDVQHHFITLLSLQFQNFHVLGHSCSPPSLQGPRFLLVSCPHTHTSPSLSLPMHSICFILVLNPT